MISGKVRDTLLGIALVGVLSGYVLAQQTGGGGNSPATPPSETAGGDLTGTYPNPTIAKIQSVAVAGVTGTGNAVLSASPTLTGNPLAPTQSAGNNSTRLATTAFVTATLPLTGTSPSIGGGVLTAGSCTTDTVTITGATTAMAVVASPVTYPGDGAEWAAYISAADTVTIKVCALVAVTPSASIYRVRVIQ